MLTRENFVGPWAGLPVAWTKDDLLDEATYRADVARCCKAGVPGVYSGGTSGEFYAMEFDEFQVVARATVEECKKYQVPCMIGCTSTYTRGAVRRVEFARQLGADAVQLALPFWMEVPDHAVEPFFEAVGKVAGDMAVSVYETLRAKKALTLEQHKQIKKTVPRYTMVKANANTLGNTIEGCKQLSEFVNVFAGEDRFYELGPAGQIGSCSSVIYYNPRIMLAIWQERKDKNWAALKMSCEKLGKLFDFYDKHYDGKGYLDSAFDSLGGIAGSFLKTSQWRRGPYPHTTKQDLEDLRQWYRDNWPEMLKL